DQTHSCKPASVQLSSEHFRQARLPAILLSSVVPFSTPDHLSNDSGSIIGVNEILERGLCSSKSSRWQTVQRLEFGCPRIHPCLNIPFKSPYASGLLRQSQAFLAGA